MRGLSSNKLKIIAIVLMIIDHIGYYYISYLPLNVYQILRFVGRISMPIFAYLIVQGFFKTSNLKKYIFKMFVTATLFQLAVFALGIINKIYVSNYYIIINTYLNILYSFTLCLVMLYAINTKKIVENKIINVCIRVLILAAIIALYSILNIELGYRVVVTTFGFYLAEKIKKKKVKNSEEIYMIMLFTTLVLAAFTDIKYIAFNLPSVISIIPISLYNGERGNKSKTIKNLFYVIYPLHHIILYALAMYITYKVR